MLEENWLDSAVETSARWGRTFERTFIFWEVVGEYDSYSWFRCFLPQLRESEKVSWELRG